MDDLRLESFVECVPNFSEGADTTTLDLLAGAIDGSPGAWLLDHSADPDHGRSVYTLAGYPGRVMSAMDAAVAVAVERIDMRTHAGHHPRIGAVDVGTTAGVLLVGLVLGHLGFPDRPAAATFGFAIFIFSVGATGFR